MNEYYMKKLKSYRKDTYKRNRTICPYCKKDVIPDPDAEYIKMKSGHETFFHKSCLYKAIQKATTE